jgi:hypothetical protein
VNHPAVTVRRLFPLLVALLCAAPGLTVAAETSLQVVRVLPGWREAASFKRIGEYFDGRERTGGEVVLRSQPAERGGYYFLIRLANPVTAAPVTLQLEVVRPGTPQPQVFSFPTSVPVGSTVFNVGLTGADWPGHEVNPVAWRLHVLAADGRVLATDQSYVWGKPAAAP